jgi:hypothetical protein
LSENLLQRPWRKKLKSTKKETLWTKQKKDEIIWCAERIVVTIKWEWRNETYEKGEFSGHQKKYVYIERKKNRQRMGRNGETNILERDHG